MRNGLLFSGSTFGATISLQDVSPRADHLLPSLVTILGRGELQRKQEQLLEISVLPHKMCMVQRESCRILQAALSKQYRLQKDIIQKALSSPLTTMFLMESVLKIKFKIRKIKLHFLFLKKCPSVGFIKVKLITNFQLQGNGLCKKEKISRKIKVNRFSQEIVRTFNLIFISTFVP